MDAVHTDVAVKQVLEIDVLLPSILVGWSVTIDRKYFKTDTSKTFYT